MNDFSITNTEMDCGIRELSVEEIEIVGGGSRRSPGRNGSIIVLIEVLFEIFDNWDPFVDRISEMIEETVILHKDGFPMQL